MTHPIAEYSTGLDDSEEERKRKDAELARHVLAMMDARRKESDVEVKAGTPRITSRVPDKGVDVKVGEPQITGVTSRDPEDGTDPAFAAKKRNTEERDKALADQILARQKANITVDEPVISRRVKEGSPEAKKIDQEFADAKPIEREEKKGSVYLQNTESDGKKTRGVEVKRSQFRTDDDFDQFVAHHEAEGNLWSDKAEKQAQEQSGGGGGTLASTVRKGIAALVGPQALSVNDVKVSGDPTSQGEAKRTLGLPAESYTSKDEPAPAARPASKLQRAASKDFAASANEVPVPEGIPAPQELPKGQLQEVPVPQGIPPPQELPEGNLPAPDAGAPPKRWGPGLTPLNDLFAPADPNQPSDPLQNTRDAKLMAANQPPPADLSGQAMGAAFAGNAGAAQAAMSSSRAAPGAPSGPGAPPIPGFPKQQGLDQEMADQANLIQQAMQHSADITKETERHHGEILQSKENEIAKAQLRFQQQTEFVQQGQARAVHTMDEAQQVLNNPARTPDPERYWKSHSKIMFAIGVGLLAQAGKDIGGVLSNVNSAIDRDIEAQKHEFEAPREAAKAKMAGAQLMYGQFRDQGHDAFASQQMAMATMKDFYANQIDKLAANTNSEQAQNNATMAAAQMRQESLKARQAALQHEGTLSVAEFNATENARHNRAEEGIDRRKAVASEKAVPDATRLKLADLKTTISQLQGNKELFKNNPAWNAIMSLDPTGTTDASNWDKNRQIIGRALKPVLDQGARYSEAQIPQFVDAILPKSYSPAGQARFDNLLNQLVDHYNGEIQALGPGRKGNLEEMQSTKKPSWLKPY